jgi:hypothetical protein
MYGNGVRWRLIDKSATGHGAVSSRWAGRQAGRQAGHGGRQPGCGRQGEIGNGQRGLQTQLQLWHLASEASAGASHHIGRRARPPSRSVTAHGPPRAQPISAPTRPRPQQHDAVEQRACQLIPASPQHNTHEGSALACLWPRPLPATACPSSTTAVCTRYKPHAAVLPCCHVARHDPNSHCAAAAALATARSVVAQSPAPACATRLAAAPRLDDRCPCVLCAGLAYICASGVKNHCWPSTSHFISACIPRPARPASPRGLSRPPRMSRRPGRRAWPAAARPAGHYRCPVLSFACDVEPMHGGQRMAGAG